MNGEFLQLLFLVEIYLFLSFAGVLARQVGAKHIITGVCETDFSGYPDCRDIFIKSLECHVESIDGLLFCYSYTVNVVEQSGDLGNG